MHRIDSVNNVANKFKDTPTPGTKVSASWLNAVQEELCNVIEASGVDLSKPDNDQLLQAIRLMGGYRPGRMEMWGGAVAPEGTLECDGSEVLKVTFPALFAAIGNTWGVASDDDYFVLPDMRGRMFRGWDHGAGRDPGRALGSYQEDELKAHTHGVGLNDPEGRSDGNTPNVVPPGGVGTAFSTASTGGTETRPKNAAGMIIIQT